jgi:predicted PP-loop superfamily ATPase
MPCLAARAARLSCSFGCPLLSLLLQLKQDLQAALQRFLAPPGVRQLLADLMGQGR